MSDKTIKWTFDADPAPLDSALEASGKKADDLGDKLKAAADEHRAAMEKAASDIKKMFDQTKAHSEKATKSAGAIGDSFKDAAENADFFEQAVRAASDFVSGNFGGAIAKMKGAFSSFRRLVSVNPYTALIGFTIAAAAVVVKSFKEMGEKTDELKRKLEDLRDFRSETSANIQDVGKRTYDENLRRAAARTESIAELKSMLAATEAEVKAREATARKNQDEYEDMKRKAAMTTASGNWLKDLFTPKNAEASEKGRRIDEQAERMREKLLDPSIKALGEARRRADDLRDRIEAVKNREAERAAAARENAAGDPGVIGSELDPDLVEGWVKLAKEKIGDTFPDILSKLNADLEYARARRSYAANAGTDDGRREELYWAREELEIEREITAEKKRRDEEAKRVAGELKTIKESAELIGLEREDWLKKRIGQVRERFKEEEDPVEKARLGLIGKQLTHELKTLTGVDSGASKEKADTRPLSPTGSGVHMNDMSKVSAGGVKLVRQPFNTNKSGYWQQSAIVGSSSLNELMDLGRGQSPLSVDPQAKIAQNTEKTNELLQDIRANLKGVK